MYKIMNDCDDKNIISSVREFQIDFQRIWQILKKIFN